MLAQTAARTPHRSKQAVLIPIRQEFPFGGLGFMEEFPVARGGGYISFRA